MSNGTSQATPASRRRAGEGGLRLGRVAGVTLHAHWSLLVIFWLIVVSLGGGTFRLWHPQWSAALSWTVALGAAILFFASIAAHELAHAVIGRRHGVPIDRITLFVFGGMAHMRAAPPTPKAELLMAIAGPALSLVIGVLSLALGVALARDEDAVLASEMFADAGPVATLLLWLGPINIVLALFNILPGFPLDGGRVARAIGWWATGDIKRATRWASGAGAVLGWILIGFGVLMVLGARIPLLGRGPFAGFWAMLIGWFLYGAARASYQQLLVRDALAEVPVQQVMRVDVIAVPPALRVDVLVNDFIMRYDQRSFPVVADGRLVGLVSFVDVRNVPRERWTTSTVGEVMTPMERLEVVRPEAPAYEALERLGRMGVSQIPVVDGHGELRGLVRREDLLKFLWLHGEGEP
jgi:Zn-dependent protease